ncbi:MAG TPA: diguanylate cyclase [Pantanalinema sp.]
MEPDVENTSELLDRLLICLSGLGDMAAEITSNSNLKGSMRTVLRMIKGTFAISKATIVQCQPETRRLTMLAAIGVEERLVLKLSDRAERFWLSNDTPLDAEAMEREPALRHFLAQNEDVLAQLPTTLWIPLVMKGQFYGLLVLSDKLGGAPYSATDRDLLGVMARQIAVALHNHALNFKLDLKVVELERLHEISSIIHSSLNRQTIVRELVGNAVSLLNARRGILMSYDDHAQQFEFEAAFGFTYWPVGSRFKVSELWLEDVLRSGEGQIWHDPLMIPAELDSFTCLAVPIKVRDRVVGVLAVFDKEAGMGIGSFTDSDCQLLAALAVQAAASIENARLYELATVDGLTKLYIRRHFEQRFVEEMRRSQRYGSPLGLMMIDIDFFKKFNDSYGHATGDEVLKLVAATIRKCVREDLDIPARYGGEEMMVLMPETGPEGAVLLAERIRQAIESTDLPGPNGETLHVAVSIGVATFPEHATSEDQLMELADQALYVSKRTGRNRVTLYAPEATAHEVS